jgi:NADH-ubiquinone oxidoreductase chain 2
MFRRISAISFAYAGVLAFNTLDIQSIGSGIGLYSGLLKVSFLSNFFAIFILIVSSIILIIWPNFSSATASQELRLAGNKNTNIIYYNNIENDTKSNEYSLIVMFNILGALFLISSLDLISMYLSIELQSFGLYILATLYKEKYSSTAAGLKYFLLGGLSSCIILLGCGIIYSYIGLTNLDSINAIISVYFINNPSIYYSSINSLTIDQIYNLDVFKGMSLGLILIFSGFLFKIAASPFHNWAPDVYDDSPTLVTTWLTIMPKISILVLLLELMLYSAGSGVNISNLTFLNILPDAIADLSFQESTANVIGEQNFILNFDLLDMLTNLLIISSLLSLIIGSIVGLSQIRIKRLLAYSTISHIGFLLLALSVFSKSSIEAFIFYIIQYTITNLDIFLIILAMGYIFKVNITRLRLLSTNVSASSLRNAQNTKSQDSMNASSRRQETIKKINLTDIEYINNLKGIFYKNPLLSISFSICLFSFAGVPPLIGFFAKQQVLYSSNSAGFYFLSLIAILVSVISASYYLKIIKVIHSYPSNVKNIENNKSTAKRENNVSSYVSDIKNLSHASQGTSASATQTQGTININKRVETVESYNYFTSIHAFIIGFLTLSIVLFIFNPELILNCIAIVTNLIFNI